MQIILLEYSTRIYYYIYLIVLLQGVYKVVKKNPGCETLQSKKTNNKSCRKDYKDVEKDS